MTDRTVLFHVGLPKAASTFLQRRVFPALDADLLHILVHPKPWEPTMRLRGSTAFLDRADEARAAITAAEKDIIVSSEGFVLGTTTEQTFDYEARARRLQEIWPAARILVVLRRQDDFCRSLYLNSIEKAYPYPPERFLELKERDGARDRRCFPYTVLRLDRIVSTYEDLFGAENVLTLPYELLKAEPAQFIEAIRGFGNYRLGTGVTPGVQNRGLSRAGYAAARLLNQTCLAERQSGRQALAWLESRGDSSEGWRGLHRMVTSALAAQQRSIGYITRQTNRLDRQAPRVLSPGAARQIMDYHAEGNRSLSARRNLALDRYGYF